MLLKALNISEPIKDVVHLEFPSQDLMARTFLRFAEYYESPEFKGKVFTLEEYKKWYVSVKGKWSYVEDWPGFNIPSEVLKPFKEGKFDPLSPEEKAFLKIFEDRPEPFYIIGTSKENPPEYFTHEISHALFYINSEYRNETTKTILEMDPADLKTFWKLINIGYHNSVKEDEIQAHFTANFDELVREGLDEEKFRQIHKEFLEIYKRHYLG